VIPQIESLQDFSEVLQTASSDYLRLILWEKEEFRLKEALERSKEKKRIFFIVGPEGGFSLEEIEEAKRAGFFTVTLGKRVLRAETASLCLLSILQYDRGDIG
jgi:16S rRNA (uracil1498-N3)-methyltransferase